MAYQPINYAGIAPIENTGMSQFSDMFSKAINAGSMPQRRSQEMQAAELANALSQVKLGAAPEQMNLEQELMKAKIAQAKQRQEFAPDIFSRALEGFKKAQGEYAEDDPRLEQYANYVDNMSKGKEGITIEMDPITNQPRISIGGSGKGGGGLHQTNNQFISQLTPTQQTAIQKKIDSAEALSKLIGKLGPLGDYNTAGGKIKLWAQQALNTYGGANFKSPSEYAKADTASKKTIEQEMTSGGLSKDKETTHMVKTMYQPAKGETKEQFLERMADLTEMADDIVKTGKKGLFGGIRGDKSEFQETETVDVEMPTFSSREDARKYLSSLSPEDRQKARQKMLGR